jgi:hypothetical protein
MEMGRQSFFNQIIINLNTNMKKIILTVATFVLSMTLHAQQSIGKFTMSFTDSEFSVEATEPKDGEYKLYIDMFSLDKSVKAGGITVKSKDVPALIALLQDVKAKYTEWEKLAQENGVAELDKEIPTANRPKCGGFFRYGDWKFDYSVTLSPRFFKTPDNTLALVHTGKMIASDNQYIDASDFVFAFKNAAEIDELISLLDPQKVIDFYSKKTDTEDLFN